MNVVFTPTAWQQYTDWQKEDKKIVKRINDNKHAPHLRTESRSSYAGG